MNKDLCPFNCPMLNYGYNFIKCQAENEFLKFNETLFGVERLNNCQLTIKDNFNHEGR